MTGSRGRVEMLPSFPFAGPSTRVELFVQGTETEGFSTERLEPAIPWAEE
jgi:hypothetical protein